MSQRGFRTASRRYHYLFWPMMVVYAAVILATTWLLDENTAPLWLKIVCAMLTTAPMLIVLFAMRRLTEETDEYTRMNQLKALRDGGLITAGAIFLVGFLQIFDVIQSFDVFWFGPLFFFAYGLSAMANGIGKTV